MIATTKTGCVVSYGEIKRPQPPARRTVILLQMSTMTALKIEARRRGMSADEFATALLHTIASDDLYAAVLDR